LNVFFLPFNYYLISAYNKQCRGEGATFPCFYILCKELRVYISEDHIVPSMHKKESLMWR